MQRTGPTIPKLPRDVRERIKNGPYGKREDVELWLISDTDSQARRDMQAVGLKLARKFNKARDRAYEQALASVLSGHS